MLRAIQQTIDQLPAFRQDRSRWSECDYHAETSAQGTADSNSQQRLKTLIALQYHAEAGDEDLIRYLFTQETISREQDGFSGYGEALELGAYLLATFRRPADIWLFARAKRANFDTLCGFSSGYFLFCGLQSALDEIAGSHHELTSFVREYLLDADNAPRHDESEIDQAWQHLKLRFPGEASDEDLMVWVDRAIELGALDEGRELLRTHENRHAETQNEHSFTWKMLGDYARAIAVKRIEIADATEPWDQVSGFKSLADLYVLNSQAEKAWALVQQCNPLLSEITSWHEVGLGRMLVETAFDIVNQLNPGHPAAPVAFGWACERFDDLTSQPLVLREKAAAAAQRVHDDAKADYFQKLAEQERRNVDQMF